MCHYRFRLPRHIAVTEEAIADWLWQERREEEEAEATEGRSENHGPGQIPAPDETAVLEALTDKIRLVRVNRKGALFEFPPKRLTEAKFRCAMPRRCIRCNSTSRLMPHVVIYAPQLQDSFSLEAEHAAGELTVSDPALIGLDGEALLSKLPKVPNVPPPGHLPMPYWLCDMCTGSGMISGEIQINTATGQGLCRLLIRNLRQAEAFLIAAGSEGTQDHAELRQRIAATEERPWDNLVQVVQHRLEGWYRPAESERFLAYIPDRDRSRTEDGMSGVVVSNCRLIYHTPVRHREARVGEPLELHKAFSGGRGRLRIKSPNWEAKSLIVDGDGIARLRQALTKAKFNVTWH